MKYQMFAVMVGGGGWRRVKAEDAPSELYVRVTDIDGARRVTELVIANGGRPITGDMLRGIPVSRLEMDAQEDELDALVGPGVDPLTVVRHFQHFPDQAPSEIAPLFARRGGRASLTERGTRATNLFDIRIWQRPLDDSGMKAIDGPTGGRLSDDFLQAIAEAYRTAVSLGQPPAKAILRYTTPRPQHRTVHYWIKKARERGFLAPATSRGRVV